MKSSYWCTLWAHYLGVDINNIEEKDVLRIDSLCRENLRAVPEKLKVQLARKHLDPILKSLPHNFRLALTSTLKKIRNPKGKTLVTMAEDWPLLNLYREMREKHPGTPFTWQGKKAALCLTHDVDNRKGYLHIPAMLKRQKQLGMKGTFNFVTRYDYEVESRLVEEMQASGFEVGLHCLTHDIGLAYRHPRVIERTLSAARDMLPVEPRGYRSAALSISPNLLDVVSKIGITYDSTCQITNPVYHNVGWPFPFYLEEHGLWELPLTIQDDVFVRDASLSTEDTVEILSKILDAIIEVGGLFVIILHPHVMVDHPRLYEAVLDLFDRHRDDLFFANSGEIVDLLQDTNANPRYHSQ